jgi:CBS domain containing-hemolysin-like protein
VRVSARYPVDDLADLVGVGIDDEDVDSVGGLLAKHLGKVPIAGSQVVVEGLRLTAEAPTGRRNRIGRVVISPVTGSSTSEAADTTTEQPTAAG